MSKSIWSGSLSFGLINIEVTLHPATKSKTLQFHFLNKEDKHPIRYQRVDAAEGKVLETEELVKGFEFEKGAYVVLDKSDFEAAEIKTGRNIDILNFIDTSKIDPVYFQKTYFLAPTEISQKAYDLLVKVLKDQRKAALVRFVLRDKQHLALIRAKNFVLLVHTMFYSDEVTDSRRLIEEHKVEASAGELELAKLLVEKLTSHFDPEQYKDQYRENLQKIINDKLQGREIAVPKIPERKPVVDIMSALRESIEKAKREEAA